MIYRFDNRRIRKKIIIYWKTQYNNTCTEMAKHFNLTVLQVNRVIDLYLKQKIKLCQKRIKN